MTGICHIMTDLFLYVLWCFCPYLPKYLVRRCLPLQTERHNNIKLLQHTLKVTLLIDTHCRKQAPSHDKLYCTYTPADGARDEITGWKTIEPKWIIHSWFSEALKWGRGHHQTSRCGYLLPGKDTDNLTIHLYLIFVIWRPP